MDHTRGCKPFNAFFLSILAFGVITGCGPAPGETGEKASGTVALDVAAALSGPKPIFVSDYFSFVGADETGHVVFAIDNDRSRRGSRFDADAHVFLHDERDGWISVSGSGSYRNRGKELLRIPDSPDFYFHGEAASGITLDSPRNGLTLTVEPMQERFARSTSEAIFSLGSASATLSWKGRVIPGRVIYEYIFMVDLSPWYSYLSGLFYNDFQGLYLETADDGDCYLRSEKGTAWSRAFGRVPGFLVLDRKNEAMKDPQIEVSERSLAFGFYTWPAKWHVSWQGSKGAGSLSVAVLDRKIVTTWIIGGYAMAVVSGELSYGGKTRPVYGLAELIR
jgi:hypothetical protein